MATPDARLSTQCEVVGRFLESENPLPEHGESVRVGEKLTGASQAIQVSF
jgi:hypothetical protein